MRVKELGIILTLICLFSSTNSQEEDPCKQEYKCPHSTGNFADPCTCRRFYKCDGFVAYKNICPTGLHWDDLRKYCNFKTEAVCGPLPEGEPKIKEDVEAADKCDPEKCALPYCYCSKDGTKAPTENPPQIILLMLEGAVNQNNYFHYVKLLNHTQRDTNCKIKATFFLRHEYSNYRQIQQLYADGNELALSSMTSTTSLQNENATTWRTELNVLKETLKRFSSVPSEDILGVRAPGLKPGHNTQYEVMVEDEYVWDSSVTTYPLDKPVWPYTLDYSIPHKCKISSCPKKAFPGLWEIPLNLHFVKEEGGGECPSLDQCIFTHQSSDDIFNWLKQDFERFYNQNRAPYTFPFHTNWFTHPTQVEGLLKFITWSLTQKDVYYMTVTELLIWMTEPDNSQLPITLARSCEDNDRPQPCSKGHTCELPHTEPGGIETLRYMATCYECPHRYPWV
ncbi:chitin deacetylase 1 [Lepeophtheirus salmonis]|uniref:Chitin-binding type-2 domain-containing protein n=1 Tax=Lepeophtheirus salmonis TaxID=72036 RepID=A0A0K2UAB0_LEPSM|nr:chitin deacetylase 1-like [Lepeophtheirus salmonis]